jgi:hypothetical protein
LAEATLPLPVGGSGTVRTGHVCRWPALQSDVCCCARTASACRPWVTELFSVLSCTPTLYPLLGYVVPDQVELFLEVSFLLRLALYSAPSLRSCSSLEEEDLLYPEHY